MRAVTAFVQAEVRRPPSTRRRSTWPRDSASRSILTCRSSSTGCNHQRLLNRLAQRVADGRILKLVHRMLKAKVVLPDGARITTEEGTPQGGPLSPLLSNIVLDELDWELARRGLRFVRYADDFSVFVRSERAGRRVMDSSVSSSKGAASGGERGEEFRQPTERPDLSRIPSGENLGGKVTGQTLDADG